MSTVLTLILLPLDYPAALLALLFFVLAFSGLGLVVLPEEVMLLLGGYLAYLEFIPFPAAIAVLAAGILVADISGYWVGRLYGEWIKTHIVRKWKFAAVLFEKVVRMFANHGEKMVIFSRPLFAVRAAIPMFAGHTGMNFKKFILYDALVSIPWAILLVSASYYLSATFDVFAEARVIKHGLIIAVGIAIVSWLGVLLIKNIISRD